MFADAAHAAAELGQQANLLGEAVRLRLSELSGEPDGVADASLGALEHLAAELADTGARLREHAFGLSRALDSTPLRALDADVRPQAPLPPMRRFSREQWLTAESGGPHPGDAPEISEGMRVIVTRMVADGKDVEQVAGFLRDHLYVDEPYVVIHRALETRWRRRLGTAAG